MSYQLFEVELTDRCNASCSFCPRDKRPKPHGFMTQETFSKLLQRIISYQEKSTISFCGRGEPSLHPRLCDFIAQASQAGVRVVMTSNASLINKNYAAKIFDAGLQALIISAASMPDDYDKIYKLPFEQLSQNINQIQQVATERKKDIRLAYVAGQDAVTKENETAFKNYWRKRGIKKFVRFDQINRAGSLDSGQYDDLPQLSPTNKKTHWLRLNNKKSCFSPFTYHYTFWNGNYGLCSHEWQERVLLGNVFDTNLNEYQIRAMDYFSQKIKICSQCDIYYQNKLDTIYKEAIPEKARKIKIRKFREQQKYYKDVLRRKKYSRSIEVIKELF